MDLNKTGKYLKKLREENNLTQKDVAYQLNISVQAVSKWETGKSFPRAGRPVFQGHRRHRHRQRSQRLALDPG